MFSENTKWEHGGRNGLNNTKKETKEPLGNVFLNENTSVNIKSSVKVLKLHGHKCVTALSRFSYFRNLSD